MYVDHIPKKDSVKPYLHSVTVAIYTLCRQYNIPSGRNGGIGLLQAGG